MTGGINGSEVVSSVSLGVWTDSTIYADARMQQVPKLASYFEMHVRGATEVYDHVDQHWRSNIWWRELEQKLIAYNVLRIKHGVVEKCFSISLHHSRGPWMKNKPTIHPSVTVNIMQVSFEDGNTYH